MAINWIGLRVQEVLNDYIESNLRAKQQRQVEYIATIKIQVAIRRFLARQLIKLWHQSAKEIQRFYRGHLGREYFYKCRRKQDYELRMAYFNYHATYIQCCFKGYWSRKYICDYYARKNFIHACLLAGKRVKALCTMNYKLEIHGEEEKAKKKIDAKMNKFFNQNHYRRSTEVVKGAFYSSYVAIFGRGHSYLEEHVHDACCEEFASMELEKLKGLTEDGIPIKQAQNVFYIKSSKALHSCMNIDTQRRLKEASLKTKLIGTFITRLGHYESQYEHRRKYEKWSSLLDISDKRFDTIVKRNKAWWINMEPSIRNGEPYHLQEMLAKASATKELEDYPIMKDFPFTTIVPNGLLFEIYKPFDKVFSNVMNNHQWPKYPINSSIYGALLPPLTTHHS